MPCNATIVAGSQTTTQTNALCLYLVKRFCRNVRKANSERVTMVDRLQDVVDRGCSSNCNNRKFVWTDEFQVYCCNDQDYCNHATTVISSVGKITLWTFVILAALFTMRGMAWWQWLMSFSEVFTNCLLTVCRFHLCVGFMSW